MFDYKQRPFVKSLTDEEYDRATGRLAAALPKPSPKPSPTLTAALEILKLPTEAVCQKRGRKTPPLSSKRSR